MPVRRRLRSLAAEDGFTLPELLTGMVVAVVVLFAAFQTLDTVVRNTGQTQRRVEANQRGRAAMDDVIRRLRSQVCLTAQWSTIPAAKPEWQPPIIVAGAAPTTTAPTADGTQSVAFYTDLQRTAPLSSAAATAPEIHVLTFDGAAYKLRVDVYRPTINAAGKATYSTFTRRTLLSNVHRKNSTTPVFQFFAKDPTATPPQPTLAVQPWSSDGKSVAKMTVTFDVWPTDGKAAADVSSVLSDDVFVREVDPNDSAGVPNCT
jgi:prepilin-type N-terminal cleavage/methylation domain-containing protein